MEREARTPAKEPLEPLELRAESACPSERPGAKEPKGICRLRAECPVRTGESVRVWRNRGVHWEIMGAVATWDDPVGGAHRGADAVE